LKIFRGMYAYILIIGAVILTPIGIFTENPELSSIGTVMIISGFLTHVYFKKCISKLDSVLFLIFSGNIIYLCIIGSMNYKLLLLIFPILLTCIVLFKFSGDKFVNKNAPE